MDPSTSEKIGIATLAALGQAISVVKEIEQRRGDRKLAEVKVAEFQAIKSDIERKLELPRAFSKTSLAVQRMDEFSNSKRVQALLLVGKKEVESTERKSIAKSVVNCFGASKYMGNAELIKELEAYKSDLCAHVSKVAEEETQEMRKWLSFNPFIDLEYSCDEFVKGTREDAFAEFSRWYQRWLAGDNSSKVFAFVGEGGMGKSVVAGVLCGIGGGFPAGRTRSPKDFGLELKVNVGAVHSFSYNDMQKSAALAVLRSLSYQLGFTTFCFNEKLEEEVEQALQEGEIRKEEDARRYLWEKLKSYMMRLLLEPAKETRHTRPKTLIVLDACEQCFNKDFIDMVVDFCQKSEAWPDWLGLLLTTREQGSLGLKARDRFDSHLFDPESAQNRKDLAICAQAFLLKESKWTAEATKTGVEDVLRLSEGNFLWFQQFQKEVKNLKAAGKSLRLEDLQDENLFPPGFDKLFDRSLNRVKTDLDRVKTHRATDLYQIVLGCIFLARQSLSLACLVWVCDFENNSFQTAEEKFRTDVLSVLESANLVTKAKYDVGHEALKLKYDNYYVFMSQNTSQNTSQKRTSINIYEGHCKLAAYCFAHWKTDNFAATSLIHHVAEAYAVKNDEIDGVETDTLFSSLEFYIRQSSAKGDNDVDVLSTLERLLGGTLDNSLDQLWRKHSAQDKPYRDALALVCLADSFRFKRQRNSELFLFQKAVSSLPLTPLRLQNNPLSCSAAIVLIEAACCNMCYGQFDCAAKLLNRALKLGKAGIRRSKAHSVRWTSRMYSCRFLDEWVKLDLTNKAHRDKIPLRVESADIRQARPSDSFNEDDLSMIRHWAMLMWVPKHGLLTTLDKIRKAGVREVHMAAVQRYGYALGHASEELLRDREIVLAAVKQNGNALGYASEELLRDREIVLAAVKQKGNALGHASEELLRDREIVLAAVKQKGNALGHASEELRSDREIVLTAVKQKGNALGHASEELRSDRDFVLALVKQDGEALEYASEELRSDREIVLTAVKQNRYALRYANEELLRDREIVLTAVKQNGYALRYGSEELRSDREIVLTAVKQKGYALRYANEELLRDREIVLTAVKQNGYALRYGSEELRSDREIVLTAVKQKGYALRYANEELLRDREIVLAAVKQNGNALGYGNEELRSDREIVLTAVKQKGYALRYASEELRSDQDFVLALVKQDGEALEYASEELRSDREIVLTAVKQNGYALRYASEELRSDREIVLAAANQRVLSITLQNSAWLL